MGKKLQLTAKISAAFPERALHCDAVLPVIQHCGRTEGYSCIADLNLRVDAAAQGP
jgi:hypothetical protein